MNSRRLLLTAMIVMLTLGSATTGWADISSSAVLFLRIAPGSRAAGMGEAFVAIADDATATHWNPAGLGNAPLSDTWENTPVPVDHRPLRRLVRVSDNGGNGRLAGDVWAIGARGLVRFGNHKWSTEEVFSTKTDETLARKVRSYFAVDDEEALAAIQDRVAAVNNGGTLEEVQQFRDRLLAAVPAGHRDLEQITLDADSLVPAWRECRLDWTNVREAESRLNNGLKDSVLSDDEITRVSLSLERSRRRYLPEEIKIPYSALFATPPEAIAVTGSTLLVGGPDGLAKFNGTNWTLLTTADGVPSGAISVLESVDRSLVVGTDSGIAMFNGLTFEPLTPVDSMLPKGRIQAIGGGLMSPYVVVIGGDLYRYDGRTWKNTTSYAVTIDDTPERIADKFAWSKSSVEREQYLEKYRAIFATSDATAETPVADSTMPVTTGDSTSVAPTADSAAPAPTEAGVPGIDTPFRPGEIVEVPMIARVKGEVNGIHVDALNRIWLATQYGVFWMDDSGWHTPGYESHVLVEGESLESLSDKRDGRFGAVSYVDLLTDLNDISADHPLQVGDTIMVTANPAANEANAITSNGPVVLVATCKGAIEYDGREWAHADLRGMGQDNVLAVRVDGSDIWAASDSRVLAKSPGRYEISAMHVNWLPELANDMYYEFLAVAGPVREIGGTCGLSLTYLTYGTILRTGETSSDTTGSFTAYDLAVTGAYGTSLTNKLKAGISAKLIISRLADQGAGKELGSGTSTGFAVDFGLLYSLSPRWTWGLAITNLGPKMKYIDAAQADELPRNLAFGTAYRFIQSDYTKLIATLEMNKMLVGLDDGFREEMKQIVLNGGAEFSYINLLMLRGGYIFDQEGDVKAITLGAGLRPMDWLQGDFSYIPSQGDSPLSNTVRFSLRILL